MALAVAADANAPRMLRASFAVVLADEEPILPEAVTLAPASEDDENRTVLLVGELAAKGGFGPQWKTWVKKWVAAAVRSG